MEVIALKNQSVLEITGRDAIKFFQGYCTCNLDDLAPEKASSARSQIFREEWRPRL